MNIKDNDIGGDKPDDDDNDNDDGFQDQKDNRFLLKYNSWYFSSTSCLS